MEDYRMETIVTSNAGAMSSGVTEVSATAVVSTNNEAVFVKKEAMVAASSKEVAMPNATTEQVITTTSNVATTDVTTTDATATDATATDATATDATATDATATDATATDTTATDTTAVNAAVEGKMVTDTGTSNVVGAVGTYVDPGYVGGLNTETGTNIDPGTGSTKDPLLSSWVFVIGISLAVLFVSAALGAFLARRKIKKGIELYED